MLKPIKKIVAAIRGTEFEHKTYACGGYVRDQVRGEKANDLDLVVELPEGGVRLAEFLHKKKMSSRPVIYKRFGTAMVVMDNRRIELVMTRTETYDEDSRNPEVTFCDIQQDIMRRDFTINSLVQDICTGKIYDYSGKGLADLEAKIVRTTSDPAIIFAEDPLRMLRAVRFAVNLGFTIDHDALAAIKKDAYRLDIISWERRRDEFLKILMSPQPVSGINLLLELGLLDNIIPELLPLVGLEQGHDHHLDVWEHTLAALSVVRKSQTLRLATLLHDVAKPLTYTQNAKGITFPDHDQKGARLAKQVLMRLRFPRRVAVRVGWLIRNHLRFVNWEDKGRKIRDKDLRKMIREAQERLPYLVDLVKANLHAHAPLHRRPKLLPTLQKRFDKVKLQEENESKGFPLKHQDILVKLHLPNGTYTGKLMDIALEAWLNDKSLNRRQLLDLVAAGYNQNSNNNE